MWNEVVLDYEDETVVFGQRKVLGAPGNYDIKTLATVSTAHTSKPSPDVTCLVSADYVVLAADVQLSVFSHNCSEYLFALTFDGPFEAAALGPGGVLVLGEAGTGKLHLVSLSLQQLLVSLPLLSKEESFSKLWISPENTSGHSHLVVQTTGQELHVFTPLDPKAINQAMQSGSQEMLREFQQSFHHSTFTMDQLRELSALLKDTHPPMVRWLRHLEMELVLPSIFPGPLHRVVHSLSQKYLLVQDAESSLSVLCSTTLLPLHCWEGQRVEDFILFSPSPDCEKLVLLVTGTNPESELQVWSFPALEQQFRVVLNPWCRLATVEPGAETMMVVEGHAEQSKMVDKLLLREAKEIVPENRLNHLLRKHKFEEAKILAKLHHLNVEEIHKSSLSLILKNIAANPTNGSLFRELGDCLCHISDSTFVFNVCMQHSWPSEEVCRKILHLVQQHLQNSSASMELLSEVGRTMYRLDTFVLMPCDLYDWSNWGEFAHSSCLQLFRNLLDASHTEAAFLLWERHCAELLSTLTQQETVREILTVVPDGLSVDLLVFWLKTSLLPGLLQKCPLAFDDVAVWLKERVFALEATDRKHWPDNGLKLTSVMMEQPSTEDATQLATLNYHLVQQMMGEPQSALSQLSDLHRTLRQIKMLWSKHRCPIPLSSFLQADKKEVAYHLLDAVPEYCLASLVTSFLNTYLGQHNLDQGTVLLSYIQQVVRSIPQSWRMREEPVWHSKLLALVECIRNLDLRLSAVVAIASQSPVPWSSAVSNLVNLTLEQIHHHPQRRQLEHEKEVLGLKQVLLKYDIRNFKMYAKANARELLHMILHQAGSTLEEGLEVSKVFSHVTPMDVYYCCSLLLLESGKLDDFRDLLTHVPDNLRPELAGNLYKEVCFDLQECQLSLLEGAVSAGNLVEPKSSTLLLLERALVLWKEFGVRLSWDQLQDRQWCLKKLEQMIESSLQTNGLNLPAPPPQDGDKKKPSRATNLFFKLHRLGQLLGLKLEVRGILANSAARLGRHKEALRLFEEMAASSGSVFEIVSILRYFTQHLDPGSTDPKILDVLCDLACPSLNVAPNNLLGELVALYIWLSDLCSLLRLTEPNYSTDDYAVWKLSPIFSDKGFPPPKELLFKTYLDTFPLPATEEEFCNSTEDSTPQLVQLLTEHAQDLKAFHIGIRLCFLKKAPFIKDLVGTLVFNLTNKSSPDFPLGLGLVASIPSYLSSTFTSLRQMVGRESKSTQHMTAIGIAYAAHCHMPQVVLQLHSLYLQAYWSTRLADLKVPAIPKAAHSEAFSSQLVKRVVATRNLALLRELAESLGLDLKELVPQFLVAAAQAAPEELKPLKDALSLGPKPALIFELLQKTVSPYNYEAIGLLLEHLSSYRDHLPDNKLLSKGPALAKLLACYTRCSSPSDYEKELWQQFPTPLSEELSSTRLPFHPFLLGSKPSKIYNKELYPETLRAWLAIGALLEINKDDLLMITASNTLQRWLDAHDAKPQVEDNGLLETLAELFESISSPEKATVCATDVLRRLPASASFMKCVVAKGTIQLASWWAEVQGSQPSASGRSPAVAELTQQYHQLATTSLLQRHGLDSLYQPSTMAPEELVLALLQHPDVDPQLVEQVVAIHSLDLANLCTEAVRSWLDQVAPPEYNANETFNLTAITKMATSPLNIHSDKDWDLNKMVQLLRYSKVQQPLCLQLVDSTMKASCGTYEKCQILRALFSVSRDQLSGSREELWHRLQALTCLSDLEALHLPISLEALLRSSSHLHLVRMLLSSRGTHPLALRLSLSLCLDQGIWCPDLWGQLLAKLQDANMMAQLEKVLPLLNNHPSVWQTEAVVTAWKSLLWNTFRQHDLKALAPGVLVRIFGNLLRCPCRERLDLEDLAQLFQSAGSPLLAWGCRLLMSRTNASFLLSPPPHFTELSSLLVADPTAAIFLFPILQQLPLPQNQE